jgi:RimJ/RimL family protein N-acetyltransferase
MKLEVSRLNIRLFKLDDISEKYLSWLNDTETMALSNQRFRIHTKESCVNYLNTFAETTNELWVIELAPEQMIGTATTYYNSHHKVLDIGLLIGDRSFWGMGIGLEAWLILESIMIKKWPVRKITGGTLRENKGMIRIFEKAGMQCEAVRKEQEIIGNETMDLLYYAKFISQ